MNGFTKYWFLENFSFMSKIGRLNLMKLVDELEMKHFNKGDEIHFELEKKQVVYFLKTGAVKIVSSDTDHTKYIVKRGNVFGELSLIDEEHVINDKAIALQDGVLCFIEAEQMRGLMEQYTGLKNSVLKLNGLKIKKLERKLEDLLYKDSKSRIKEYVFDFITEFGVEKENRIEAENILSHKDIANLTNTSRQTVNNVMSQLRKDNIINYNTTSISIEA